MDASDYGLGGVLTQLHPDKAWWWPYLWGQHFTLRTDHCALNTLLVTKGIGWAGMHVAQWSVPLLCYTYDVIYRTGSLNCATDCLSRLPLPTESDDAVEPDIVAFVTGLPTLSVEDFFSFS